MLRRLGVHCAVVGITLALAGGSAAQPAQPARPRPTTPERLSEYTRRLGEFWQSVESQPATVAARLQKVLGEDGLVGPSGVGPEIAVAATSLRAQEILLTSLLGLQRKGFWRGRVRLLKENLGPEVSSVVIVGQTNQLPGPVLTIHRPFVSSLEVVDLQVSPTSQNHSLFFTELTLAAQLFAGADEVDFRLEKLGPTQAKYSLKTYDLKSRQAFLDQLQEFIHNDEQQGSERKIQMGLSRAFLEGLPERSSALRLRGLLSDRFSEQWYDPARSDFFETFAGTDSPPLPIASPPTQTVNLWISDELSGPRASENLFYSLLELLDSTPKP